MRAEIQKKYDHTLNLHWIPDLVRNDGFGESSSQGVKRFLEFISYGLIRVAVLGGCH
jgi:hypothetical protein